MKIDDNLLVQVYTGLGQGRSVDKIASFPTLRRDFLDRLAIADDDGEAIWRLLQLRKARKLPKDTFRGN